MPHYRKLYSERAEQERLQREKDQKVATQWVIVEGPIPERTWEDSKVIASFGRMPDGSSLNHIREFGNSTYIQSAAFPTWCFNVCIHKE